MSRQSRAAGRNIRGPQSALTDFLASHNISAHQIRQDADARRRTALEQNDDADTAQPNQETAAAGAGTAESPPSATTAPVRSTRSGASRAETKVQEEKRKKDEKKAIEKIKASKKLQKRKRKSGADNDDDYDELARALNEEPAAPLPGQMDNCAICSKRFTVTPYTRSGPEGGLLCNPCGKELEKDREPLNKKVKRAGGGQAARRRQVASRILDGQYQTGAKSLVTLCVELLAKNITLAEDLLGLPPAVIDKIARLLSKRRLIDPQTVSLFLQSSAEEVMIYDGAKLSSDDYVRVFQSVAGLKKLKIRNGIQFKDEVMDFLLSRNIELSGFYLAGANLLSETKWGEFLQQKGQYLESLEVQFTDKHFGNPSMALLEANCPNLKRLKVKHNQEVNGDGLKHVTKVKSLEHLSLNLHKDVHPDIYVHLLDQIGGSLRTFSLSVVPDVDNTVLDAIHRNCQHLEKLRITESEVVTDEGFVRLFKGWKNKPLRFIDFEKCRQLDASNPRENPDRLGLCGNGFRALMEHSGSRLQRLNIHACRHIPRSAFEEVFAPGKVYPELKKLEISFCEDVTDFVVGSIFRSCPSLYELNVFGCMKVKDVKVPRGKILVGVPNAMGMVIDGDDD
ncbi:RNI-like protein [Thozetella sp. PMI_491]|nr:RNI-like protein [Thozetella sp. PMI_491]